MVMSRDYNSIGSDVYGVYDERLFNAMHCDSAAWVTMEVNALKIRVAARC